MPDNTQQFSYLKPQPQVWLAIVASAGIHVGLVVFLIIGGLVQAKPSDLKDKAMITKLVRLGEEKPKNWLPDKKLASAQPAPKTPAPSTKASPDTSAKSPKKSAAKDYSKDMKKALAALGSSDDKPSKETPQGSPDGDPDGDALIAELGNAYYTQVYKQVKQNYAVPEIISERERMFLAATVVIKLDERGNLMGDLEWEKRSGNDVFDSAIANAIKKSAPFPAPPKELVDKYKTEGIGMNFRAAKM